MTKIGNFNSNIGDFPIKEKNTVVKELDNKSNSISYSQDYSCTDRKQNVNNNPFEKKVNLSASNNINDIVELQKTLKNARDNNNPQGIFKVAKIQQEQNILPNVKASDLLRESYELALSEMDSDTLYDIGNFDAQHNLLKDVSSEHIFKMADMTRKIY